VDFAPGHDGVVEYHVDKVGDELNPATGPCWHGARPGRPGGEPCWPGEGV